MNPEAGGRDEPNTAWTQTNVTSTFHRKQIVVVVLCKTSQCRRNGRILDKPHRIIMLFRRRNRMLRRRLPLSGASPERYMLNARHAMNSKSKKTGISRDAWIEQNAVTAKLFFSSFLGGETFQIRPRKANKKYDWGTACSIRVAPLQWRCAKTARLLLRQIQKAQMPSWGWNYYHLIFVWRHVA